MAIAFGGGIFGGYGPSGGSVVGGGTSGQIAYWNGSSGITGGSVATITGTTVGIAGTISLTGPLLNGVTKALTSGDTIDLFTIPLADGAMTGGLVVWYASAVSGTDREVLSGASYYGATRNATTYNVISALVGTPALAPGTSDLTGSIVVAGAAGVLTVSAYFETSLSAPTMRITYRVISPDILATTAV